MVKIKGEGNTIMVICEDGRKFRGYKNNVLSKLSGVKITRVEKATQFRGRRNPDKTYVIILDDKKGLAEKLPERWKVLNPDFFAERVQEKDETANLHNRVYEAYSEFMVPPSGQAHQKFLEEEARRAEGIYK